MSTPLRERPDAPLGTLIFRAGLLPAETIESALEEGVKTGKRLGEILTERGLLKEVDLARLLAGQKGLEFVPVREHIVDPDAASLFTHDEARLFRALPYAFDEGVPVVAIPDPTDEVVLRNIREALGRDEVRFVVSTRGEIAEIVEDVYSKPLPRPDSAAPEPPAPAPPAEEPGFVRNPEPPSPPAPEALPEQATNGNGASVDAAPLLEVAPAAPAPAPEPAQPLEVASPLAPEPELASPPVEEQLVPASPVVAEPPPRAEPEADPEPVLHAELEVVQVEPVASPEPTLTPEPAAAPESVSSPEPLPAPEPAHAAEPQAPAGPAPAPVPLPEPVSPPAPAPYPPAASAPADQPPPTGGALYEVTIRLVNGERVEAGTFQELGAAKECAKVLMAQVAAAGQGEWPFVNGRFLKPDTIVSVDIAELAGDAS
ncbi:MAG: hypothetical protein ACRDMU_07900 [Gaiellaceae bacterium]